jgi:hypothetical protein
VSAVGICLLIAGICLTLRIAAFLGHLVGLALYATAALMLASFLSMLTR